jgi:hypothetical protein
MFNRFSSFSGMPKIASMIMIGVSTMMGAANIIRTISTGMASTSLFVRLDLQDPLARPDLLGRPDLRGLLALPDLLGRLDLRDRLALLDLLGLPDALDLRGLLVLWDRLDPLGLREPLVLSDRLGPLGLREPLVLSDRLGPLDPRDRLALPDLSARPHPLTTTNLKREGQSTNFQLAAWWCLLRNSSVRARAVLAAAST